MPHYSPCVVSLREDRAHPHSAWSKKPTPLYNFQVEKWTYRVKCLRFGDILQQFLKTIDNFISRHTYALIVVSRSEDWANPHSVSPIDGLTHVEGMKNLSSCLTEGCEMTLLETRGEVNALCVSPDKCRPTFNSHIFRDDCFAALQLILSLFIGGSALGERALPIRRPRQAVRLTYVRFTVLWLLFLSFAKFAI